MWRKFRTAVALWILGKDFAIIANCTFTLTSKASVHLVVDGGPEIVFINSTIDMSKCGENYDAKCVE